MRFHSIAVTKDWRRESVSIRLVFALECFQSIGVTKDWRRPYLKALLEALKTQFPINRRHQRLATWTIIPLCLHTGSGFQSIGVTKDWRRGCFLDYQVFFTRRFQSIGVTKDWRLLVWNFGKQRCPWFPINTRHQRLATLAIFLIGSNFGCQFPINRRHLRLGSTACWNGTFS